MPARAAQTGGPPAGPRARDRGAGPSDPPPPAHSSHGPAARVAYNRTTMSGFEEVNYYFRKAARVMDLSANVERMLITPYREVKVDVSFTLDNGELGTFIGHPAP